MRYVVTGGAGFIGSNIAEELSKDKNIEVLIIDDLSSGKNENLNNFIDRTNISFIKGSITDQKLLFDITKDVDGIFHQAAIASVQRSFEEPDLTNEVNLSGTLNVLNAARKNKVKKVVLASSASIYGDNPNIPLNENEKPKPLSPYAIQKLSEEYYAESFSRHYGIDIICLRYFNVYGPHQDPKSPYSGVISIFVDKILSGKPVTIFGDGLQTRDFIYVGDVVRANLMTMEKDVKGIYNIGSGRETSLIDLISSLEELTGNSAEVKFVDPKPGDIKRSLADVSKAKNDFNFTATTEIKEGLMNLIKTGISPLSHN